MESEDLEGGVRVGFTAPVSAKVQASAQNIGLMQRIQIIRMGAIRGSRAVVVQQPFAGDVMKIDDTGGVESLEGRV